MCVRAEGECSLGLLANSRVGIVQCPVQHVSHRGRVGTSSDELKRHKSRHVVGVINERADCGQPWLANGVENNECSTGCYWNGIGGACDLCELWDGRGCAGSEDLQEYVGVFGQCVFPGYKMVKPGQPPQWSWDVLIKPDNFVLSWIVCDAINEQFKVVCAKNEGGFVCWLAVGRRKAFSEGKPVTPWLRRVLKCEEEQEGERRGESCCHEYQVLAAPHVSSFV